MVTFRVCRWWLEGSKKEFQVPFLNLGVTLVCLQTFTKQLYTMIQAPFCRYIIVQQKLKRKEEERERGKKKRQKKEEREDYKARWRGLNLIQ